MMPWKLLASADTYIFNWLIGYSALLGPDRRHHDRRLLDPAAQRARRAGPLPAERAATRASTRSRWSRWSSACCPTCPGFLKSAHVIAGPADFFDAIYVYAWFIGFSSPAGSTLGAPA